MRQAFDPEALRSGFPILSTMSRGKPLVYLDSAATTQKPQVVIDAVRDFYLHDNANIHRGVYQLSERATLAWDAARARVARFIGAGAPMRWSSSAARPRRSTSWRTVSCGRASRVTRQCS